MSSIIVVNPASSSINVVSQTQRIVLNPATSSVSIINTGPMGPRGLVGPPDAGNVLIVDGQIMTRIGGVLAPITRVNLAADVAFTAGLTAHVAAFDPHPGYMTTAEDAAIMTAHVAAVDPHPTYLTTAEGDVTYINIGGDTMTGLLTLAAGLKLSTGGITFPNNMTIIGTAADTWERHSGNTFWATGIVATDGFLAVKTGGAMTAGYAADINGSLYVRNNVINGYTLSAGAANTTRAANTIVCADASGYINGSYINMTAGIVGGFPSYIAGRNGGTDTYLRWYDKVGTLTATQFQASNSSTNWSTAAFLAYPGAGVACLALNVGSYAPQVGAIDGVGNNVYCRDSAFNGNSANIVAASYQGDSSRRFKKNIAIWPSMNLGAAAEQAIDIILKLRTITFQRAHVDIEVPSVRRMKALERLNRVRTAKSLPDYELPAHDCAEHNCIGTIEKPCPRTIDHTKSRIGLIAEEVYEVVPHFVGLDAEMIPESIDIGQLTILAIAGVKELAERIRLLEGVNNG